MTFKLPKSTKQKPLYHFSVDDVFESLIEASTGKSLFEHWFFKYFKNLHQEFGTELDLYLFFQKEIDGKYYTLENISSHIKKELQKNPWIRFGPHALNYETPPYNQSIEELIKTLNLIYKQIERFAGEDSFSKYVRLHFYSEMYELSKYFKEKGVKGLFSTDKKVISYRLPLNQKKALKETNQVEYQGIYFIRTMFRTEYLVDDQTPLKNLYSQLNEMIKSQKLLVFYVHEIQLKRKSVQILTKKLLKYIYIKKGYPFNSF